MSGPKPEPGKTGVAPPQPAADVRLSGFTPPTYDFIASLVEERWGHPALSFSRPTVVPFETATALYFVLRATDDSCFPGGKWATLQHLELLIEAA